MKAVDYIAAAFLVGVLASPADAFSGGANVALPERGLCAHRGAMATHPENTLAAFREAIRHGAHMIEFDVRLTRDNELVLMHDATVDRTTDGEGAVAEMTFAEIRALDAGGWKGEAFRGEKVPALREALRVMPDNVWLNVHLKGGEELGRRAAEEVAREGRLHQAFLACEADAARGARSVAPEIMICNMDRADDGWEYVRGTIAMKAEFIQLRGPIRPEFAEYVEALKKRGVRVNHFGGETPEDFRALFGYGVDFPLADDIADAMQVAAEFGIEPVRPVFREE